MNAKAKTLAQAKLGFYLLYQELGTEIEFYKLSKATDSIYKENKTPTYDSPVTLLGTAKESLFDEKLGTYVALEFPQVTIPIKSLEDNNLTYTDVKHGVIVLLGKPYKITEVTRKNFMLGVFMDIRFEMKPARGDEFTL